MVRDKKRSPWRKLVLLCLSALLFGLVAELLSGRKSAIEELPLPKIMHIADHEGRRHLEVPILRYKREREAAEIDFISAVHIGDERYYQELNQRFLGYDVVLYELIADPESGNKIQRGEHRDSSLGSFQRKVAEYAGLAFQLDQIDYSAKNFIHADLSPEALLKAMTDRDETPVQLLLKLLRLSFDPHFAKSLEMSGLHRNEFKDINPLVFILRVPTAAERMKMKRFLAHGLVASESVLAALEGERGLALIDDRNAEIVRVLQQQLEAKQQRIAIFYGAGHASDLHQRLRQELGLKLYKIDWLQAWDLGEAGVTHLNER